MRIISSLSQLQSTDLRAVPYGSGFYTVYENGDTLPDLDWPPSDNSAIAAQEVRDIQDAAAARQYAKLTALKSMTPAQVQTWVAANVTNLAQAQDAITTLAIVVSVLARRL